MRLLSAIRYPEWTLKRKLFSSMLLLVLLLLLTLMAGLFLFGRFQITEEDTYNTLDVQMEVFKKDILSHFDDLSAASIDLSADISWEIDHYLKIHRLTMDGLTDSADHIYALQETMIGTLQNKLLQEACSGVFVMLDATINSALEYADQSRTGLYLQINGYDASGDDTLLYRGAAEIAKRHDIMPHRKWRLEFRTDLFPNYDMIRNLASLPPEEAYYVTDLCVLPGTSEEVVLLAAPVVGSDGSFYGICGYEISASYFMTYHAQPSKLTHMMCLLCPGEDNTMLPTEGFSCGIDNGYYRTPAGPLTVEESDGFLLHFYDGNVSYIGVTQPVSLSPNNEDYHLSAMLLKSDYDAEVQKSVVQNILLWLLVLFFAVSCCLFFSRRFLVPILKGLEELKTNERSKTNIPEIDDLFLFLSETDRKHEEAMHGLIQESQSTREEKERLLREYEAAQDSLDQLFATLAINDRQHKETVQRLNEEKLKLQREKEQLASENRSAQDDAENLLCTLLSEEQEYEKRLLQLTQEKDRLLEELEQAKSHYETAQTNLSRISYRVQQEIDPDDYQCFLNGLQNLTAAERKIFNLYFDGKSAKEIQELLNIKDNTLKYHNKGIYSKLGVSSRKQLLQYAALMKQQTEDVILSQ